MHPLLFLHGVASQRGDGLRPEFMNLFEPRTGIEESLDSIALQRECQKKRFQPVSPPAAAGTLAAAATRAAALIIDL